MLAFTGNLILWIACIVFWFFVIVGVSYGIYYIIKDKRERWLVDKHQKEAEKKEMKEKWERVSKELKESGFSLEAKEKEMTPEEKAEYDKRMAKIKKSKIVVIVALSIVGMLILAGVILSLV